MDQIGKAFQSAHRALSTMLCTGARAEVDYWAEWSTIYSLRSEDEALSARKRSEHRAMSAAMRAWITCKRTGVPWHTVWCTTLIAIANSVVESFRRTGANAMLDARLRDDIVPEIRRVCGVYGVFDKAVIECLFARLVLGLASNACARVDGICAAIKRLHEFFAMDWLAPSARREGISSVSVGRESAPAIELDFGMVADAVTTLGAPAAIAAPPLARWGEFLQASYMTGYAYGDHEWLDEEFIAFLERPSTINTDVA